MVIRWFILPLMVILNPSTAHRCLAGFRSLDRQVGDSPLILIGEVLKVEDDFRDKTPTGEPHRTIATVKVSRVVKGRYSENTVRITSGPLDCCGLAGEEPHYVFDVSQKSIFILPSTPEKGEVALEHAGRVWSLDRLSSVESRLNKARIYQHDYLEEIQTRRRETYQAGFALAAELRASCQTWPRSCQDKAWDEAREALTFRLSKEEMEAIRVALALDWQDYGRDCWWRRDLWKEAIGEAVRKRPETFVQDERSWIERTLAKAGVLRGWINAYLDALSPVDLGGHIQFPPSVPYMRDLSDRDRVTTDFILGYHAYDRGRMYLTYGMRSTVLSGLQQDRVSILVRSLSGSDDENERTVASWVIRTSRSTSYVDLVAHRQLESAHAWDVLHDSRERAETAVRLAALVKYAQDCFSDSQRSRFWQSMQEGKCFEDICIEAAIRSLEGSGERKDGSEVVEAIHAYVRAAMADRSGKKSPELIPADYRTWFREHPAPPKE